MIESHSPEGKQKSTDAHSQGIERMLSKQLLLKLDSNDQEVDMLKQQKQQQKIEVQNQSLNKNRELQSLLGIKKIEQQNKDKNFIDDDQQDEKYSATMFSEQNRQSLNAYRKSAILESQAVNRYFSASSRRAKSRKASQDLCNASNHQDYQDIGVGRLRVFSDQAEQLQKLLNQAYEKEQQPFMKEREGDVIKKEKSQQYGHYQKQQNPQIYQNKKYQEELSVMNLRADTFTSFSMANKQKQQVNQEKPQYQKNQSISDIQVKATDIDIIPEQNHYRTETKNHNFNEKDTNQNLLSLSPQNNQTTHITPNFKAGGNVDIQIDYGDMQMNRQIPSQSIYLLQPPDQDIATQNSMMRYQTEPVKLITQVSKKLMSFVSNRKQGQQEEQVKQAPQLQEQENNQIPYYQLTEQQKIQQIVDLGLNWLMRLDANLVFRSIVKVQKFWKKMRRVLRSYRRRKYIVNELCETQQSYLKNLDYLIKHKNFLQVNSFKEQNPIIEQNQVNILFSNVDTLRDLHIKFYHDIQERVQSWHQYQKIGDVFIKFAPFFRLYKEYCSNYERAEKIFESHTKRPLFQNYIQELQKSQESRFLTLNSFIIMPVQRPLKYPLLLKDLLKHTRTDHPDYKNIKKAHAMMHQTNNAVNADLKKRLSEQKKIQLHNQYGEKVSILSPTRYYICQEVLTLIQAGWNKEVLIHFFSDLLLIVGKDNKQAFIGHLNMDTQSFVKNQNDLKYFQNIFTVTGGTKSYRFSAATLNKKIDALQVLQDIMKNLKNTSKSRVSALISQKIGSQNNSRKHTQKTDRNSDHKIEEQAKIQFTGKNSNALLQEPPLIVGIVGTEWRLTHTVYILVIERGDQKHRIFRRYSDFDKLHKNLNLPKLPRKRWLTFKTKVIEERKLLLQKFLQQIVLYKIFQNDLDLMDFLQITDWSPQEFKFQGQLTLKHQPASLSKASGTYQTQQITIFLCNNTIHKIPVRLDEKAIELQKRIARNYSIQNYQHWGLFVIEPYQDEKLIDQYDKPLENMKRRKGFIENAIIRLNQKNNFYCSYLKIKDQAFLFKKVFYPESEFTNQYDLSSIDYRELDLLYHQLLAMIATNKIPLQTSDLIEASAQYLYITFGKKCEKPNGKLMKKQEILRLVSKIHKKTKVQGFWQDRIIEKWQEISKLHAIRPNQNQQPAQDISLKDLKISMIKMIRRKNFYGSQFYWVSPYNVTGDEAKTLSPFFWLVVNYKSIFFISASTNKIHKQFFVENVDLQIQPTALILIVYKNPIALAGRNSKRQQLNQPVYQIRFNTQRGYEISNLVQKYQDQIRQRKGKERQDENDTEIFNRHTVF